MKRAVPVLSVLALSGALLLTGCQSNSQRCVNGKCHVTVTGDGQTLSVKEVDVAVTRITDEGMTVSVDGSAPARIGRGESARVASVMIKVTSIDGRTVKFDLE
ncbi:hypothetical protein ACTIVE_1552 [Actinomadura verrucosospora]|uniref:Lipoprotein n=1 Tax=Actinomadura verrucosospora TaxID=46165 RepID=A0A7D3VUB4_ACTVE|nr:hypothetical protein ACTIVE_1552 [Actinomadura verrucosospora]